MVAGTCYRLSRSKWIDLAVHSSLLSSLKPEQHGQSMTTVYRVDPYDHTCKEAMQHPGAAPARHPGIVFHGCVRFSAILSICASLAWQHQWYNLFVSITDRGLVKLPEDCIYLNEYLRCTQQCWTRPNTTVQVVVRLVDRAIAGAGRLFMQNKPRSWVPASLIALQRWQVNQNLMTAVAVF